MTQIQIKINPQDKKIILQAAKLQYLSLSAYMRRCALLFARKLGVESDGSN